MFGRNTFRNRNRMCPESRENFVSLRVVLDEFGAPFFLTGYSKTETQLIPT